MSLWSEALAVRLNNLRISLYKGRRGFSVVGCAVTILVSFWLYRVIQTPHVRPPEVDLSEVHQEVARGITEATKVVYDRPESGLAWGHLGMTLWAHEYANEALLCFEQAEILSASEVRWPYFRGLILTHRDRHQAAMAFAVAAMREPKNPLPLFKLCETLLEIDELEQAREQLERLLSHTPNNARTWLLAAYLADRQGQLTEAIDHARQALRLAPDHVRVISLLARLLARDGRRDDAALLNTRLKDQEGLVDIWPDPLSAELTSFRLDPYWNAFSAKRLIERGDSQLGIALLQQLVEQFPDEPAIRANAAPTWDGA